MRGSAKFETMNKGFDLEIKGGTALETMPPDPGMDVAEDEQLDNKATSGAPKKGAIRTEEDDITMAKDVDLVNDGAKSDIADGYVQDSKREVSKGYESYNQMVTKGIAADINLDSHNIMKGLDAIEEHTSEITTKALGQRVKYAAHNIGQLGKQVAGMAKDKVVAGAGAVGSKVAGVPGAVGDTLAGVGSKAENALRRANAKTTRMGSSSGAGVLGRAANVAGKNRKATGAAIVGTGAAGVGGAAYGGKKLLEDSEEKCSKAPMKVKGVVSGAKKIYESAKSGVKSGYGSAKSGVKSGYESAKSGVKSGASAAKKYVDESPNLKRGAKIAGGTAALGGAGAAGFELAKRESKQGYEYGKKVNKED